MTKGNQKKSTSWCHRQSKTSKNQFGRAMAPVRDRSGAGGGLGGLLSRRVAPRLPDGLQGGDIWVREAAFPGGGCVNTVNELVC